VVVEAEDIPEEHLQMELITLVVEVVVQVDPMITEVKVVQV
jgi:Mg2+/Co2+ transporter CorB|tara:strand:+ start:646 stop:768 length:123 start_codon:yes stop_codon:yes gene_type:complete